MKKCFLLLFSAIMLTSCLAACSSVTNKDNNIIDSSTENSSRMTLSVERTEATADETTNTFLEISKTSTLAEKNTVSNPSEETKPFDGKIIMPNCSSDYIGSEYTIDTLIEHFTELGFTNISSVPCKPDDDNYQVNIREMTIKTGWFSEDSWETGEKFDSDDEITIYYNEFPMLTVDNCSDLITILTSKDMDYMTFANKYDGQYVEFEAYVATHSTYDGGTSHIINVTGGDYDRDREVGHYDDEYYNGLIIRVGDRTWQNDIDESVEEGQNVTVRGKIDASWCEYYKQLYVECLYLGKR